MAERTSTDLDREQAERLDRMDRAGQIDRGGRGGREVSGWAVGGAFFAAVLMMIVGVFHIVAGLVALIRNQFYVATPNYLISFSMTGWGWVHIGLGVLLLVAGYFVLSGNIWARSFGIAIAALSAIDNFLFIPHYPFWSLLMIAIDVWVIWALATYSPRRVAAY
jgi:hypothetical protein